MPFSQPYVANPYPYSYAQTLPLANTLYDVNQALVAGVYTISWSGGGTVTIDFYNGTTLVGTATGTSSITYNLPTGITNYKMWNTVSATSIVIALSGLAIAPIAGTVYTYTTSQTIPLVGDGYAILVGAPGSSGTASGGTGAIVTIGRITLTGSQAFVAGVPGAPAATAASNTGVAGTASTFAGFTANGGGGCSGTNNSNPGIAGSPNGVAGVSSGANGNTTSSMATISSFSFFGTGSIGSGGGGNGGGTTGGGTVFGVGGAGNGYTYGGNATGMGSSGGGTSFVGGVGGAGSPGGLIIVL